MAAQDGFDPHAHTVTKADHLSREYLDAFHDAVNAYPHIPLYIKSEIFERARAAAGGKVKARNRLEAAEPNLTDVLQADLADEVEAHQIYTAQAETATDQAIKDKLLEIAADERQHAEELTKLLDGLTGQEKAADDSDVHVDAPLGTKPEKKEFESDSSGSTLSVSKALQIPISKVDNYQHKVAGVVLSPNEVDLQGDICTPEEIEKASDGYMIRSQTVGNRHEGVAGAVVVQNYIAPVDFMLGNQPVKKDAWVMVVKINDPVIWNDVLEGKITGFSIGGKGVRTPMEEPLPLL